MALRLRVCYKVRLRSGLDRQMRVAPPGDPEDNNRTARITDFLKGTRGGVCLDRRVRGMLYWNTADLVRMPLARARRLAR
jgi:hypothetical protein